MAREQGDKTLGNEPRCKSSPRYSDAGLHRKQLGLGNCISACAERPTKLSCTTFGMNMQTHYINKNTVFILLELHNIRHQHRSCTTFRTISFSYAVCTQVQRLIYNGSV